MALTGALTADFSDFVTEANKASAALGVMEAEAKKTGVTMAKTGQVVDGFGAGKVGGLSDLSGGLRSLDATANALGYSLGKPIGLIDELGRAAATSASSMTLMASAGAFAAAAVVGIELGPYIGKLIGANKLVNDFADAVWGTVPAADIAANKQAVLDLALKNTGQAFTDVNLAAQANIQWAKEHQRVIKTAADRQAYWEGELRKFGGALPKMEAALANHTATVKQLALQYGINADALTYYLATKKDEAAILQKTTQEAEAAAAAQQKLKESMFGGDSITKANEMALALGGVGSVSRMTTEEQAKLNTAVGEAIETYKRWGDTAPAALNEIYLATLQLPKVVTGLGSEFASLGTKFTPSADAIIADIGKMKTETAAYEAETQRMVDEAQKIAPPIAVAAKETQQLTVAFNQASSAIRMTAAESIQAGKVLEQAYRDAGIFVGQQIATGGYQQSQRLQAGREVTGAGQTWGNTLNVNVNSTEASNISKALVDEMRRNGVRF